MEAKHQTGLVWFNLDLRLIDNLTLIRAAEQCQQFGCCFVIDEAGLKETDMASTASVNRVGGIYNRRSLT